MLSKEAENAKEKLAEKKKKAAKVGFLFAKRLSKSVCRVCVNLLVGCVKKCV